jgi:hypothetical protein
MHMHMHGNGNSNGNSNSNSNSNSNGNGNGNGNCKQFSTCTFKLHCCISELRVRYLADIYYTRRIISTSRAMLCIIMRSMYFIPALKNQNLY